jgi:hypothetical protein
VAGTLPRFHPRGLRRDHVMPRRSRLRIGFRRKGRQQPPTAAPPAPQTICRHAPRECSARPGLLQLPAMNIAPPDCSSLTTGMTGPHSDKFTSVESAAIGIAAGLGSLRIASGATEAIIGLRIGGQLPQSRTGSL